MLNTIRGIFPKVGTFPKVQQTILSNGIMNSVADRRKLCPEFFLSLRLVSEFCGDFAP